MRIKIKRGIILAIAVTMALSMSATSVNAAKKFTKKAPKGVMATAVENRVVVSWEPVSGANMYRVYEAVGKGKLKAVGDTYYTKAVLLHRKRGVTYRYVVKPYHLTVIDVKTTVKSKVNTSKSKMISGTIATGNADAVVKTKVATVRKGKNIKSKKIKTLKKGKAVKVASISYITENKNGKFNKWYYLPYYKGYVASGTLKIKSYKSKDGVITKNIPLRKGAGSKFAKVGNLKKGNIVNVTLAAKSKNGDNWVRIKSGKKTGFIKFNRVVGLKKEAKAKSKPKTSTKNKKKYKIVWGKSSVSRYTTTPKWGKTTLKNFLRSAIAPMGSTMYVWGGGWDKEDKGSGQPAVTVGTSPRWRSFAATKKKNYNYRKYKYKINDGLDCSGYVGWLMYNAFNTADGKKGFVKGADKQGKLFAKMKYGKWTPRGKFSQRLVGDIMSGPEHIWIYLGRCKDGSMVVLHSSPAGVKLSGTPTPKGKRNSKAAALAKKYMKKYYPSWDKRYPDSTLRYGRSYFTDYGRFRFDPNVVADPDGYKGMTAEKVLADLFKER